MKKKALRDFTAKKKIYGRLFILPWVIGFMLFFLVPLAQSLAFVFSKVTLADIGINIKFTGIKNIKYIFYSSAGYVDNLIDSISSFVFSIPLIVALSLIIATMLNVKFKGRLVFRLIFFLPVIISTGVVITYIKNDAIAMMMRDNDSVYLSGMIDFSTVLNGLNLPETVTDTLSDLINRIFDLIWNCGIQIVLFISGLQSIPEQLYDVSKVEGATKWEEFWYVTFPMLRGSTLLVIIYTAVELFSDPTNPVLNQAYTSMQQQIIGESSAMLWVYFSITGTMLFLIIALLNKLMFSKWE